MLALRSRKEFAARVLLSAVILFNALAPAGASAQGLFGDEQATNSITNINNDIANSITLGTLDAPRNERVPILSEEIAKQAQQNQEEEPVHFRVEAEPAIYIPGKPIRINWKVQGAQSKSLTLSNAEVVVHAPAGLISADANATLTPDGLLAIPLQGKKESAALSVSKGAEFPMFIDVDLLVNDDLIATQTVMIDQPRFSVDKIKGGNLQGMGGKVQISVPANAINESLAMDIREPAPQSLPGISLTGRPLEIIAVGKNSQKNIHQFKAPLKIQVKYDEAEIFDWNEIALTLYYYDPDVMDWFPIETIVDTDNNTLTAYSDHLTVFDYKANNWQSQMVPTVDAFKVADFTGAGTYQVNLWTPPGPDGLQPNLTLSYNSQVIDESSAFSQSSWVGMDWDLDTGSITRNTHGTAADNGEITDDTFVISTGGISGTLLPISVDGEVTTFTTTDQTFTKVIYDGSFKAWTKDGTKYVFSFQTSTNQSQGCSKTMPSPGIPITWRWSLTNVTDVHGNTLTYDYDNATKPNCLNQVAVYPKTITYGNYQIQFVREARTDFQTSWEAEASKTFYGKQRLKEVQVKHNGAIIRKYVMSYAPNDSTNIYPNFTWSGGGKTLTLVGVQEFGTDGLPLPAVRFTYGDKMHVTKVDNGQGGQVELEYERWTYFDDLNKDLRSLRTRFGTGGNECFSGYGVVTWTRASGTGVVRCDLSTGYMQVGGKSTTPTQAVAHHTLPEHMVKPGARYRYYVLARAITSTRTFNWGLASGSTLQLLPAQSVGTTATAFEMSIEMPVTFNPAATNLRLDCNYCFFKDIQFMLMPLVYRVTSRTVTASPTPAARYTYSYDNAAPHTTDNSAAVNIPGANLYTKVLREFRGHAMTQAVNPEGLATVNWFHQTDNLKGRAYDTLTMKRDFYDSFDTSINTTNWVATGGTQTLGSNYNVDFDTAVKSTIGTATWISFARTSATLTSGEAAIAHVRLSEDVASENNAQGEVGLVGGQSLLISMNASAKTASVNGTPLLSAGNFLKDEWYGVMFIVDAVNGSRVRIWQLDNPANFGETVVSGVGSGTWTFRDRVYDGVLSFDSYFEGVPYTETITRYNTTVQYTNNNSAIVNIKDPATNNSFDDLQVAWNTVTWEEQRNYNGDAKFVGTRQSFTYAPASQYGNMLTQTDYENNNGTLTAYRGTKYEYYPNNTSTIYIVSLPARQVTLACPGETCDFTNLTNKQAETYSFYDGATTYTTSPTKGDLTKQRDWVQNDDYSQMSYGYDTYGNSISQTAYTGYATAAQAADPAGARTIYTCYGTGGSLGGQACADDGYHTHPIWTLNPLGQMTQTGYDYNFGLPNSETAPTGAVTSATHDGFGRLKTITAPLDSSPTLQIAYYDNSIPFRVDLTQAVDANASIRMSHFYDGAGRKIQTQTVGAVVNGQQKNVVADYQYDNLGRQVRQSVPRVINYASVPAFAAQNFTTSTVTVYDVMGRMLSVTRPNQNAVTYAYTELATTMTDAKLASTTTTVDVWGRTTLVDASEGPDVSYQYDVLGRMTTASRGGLTTTIQYDALGRKLNMNDPDMGYWVYEYDALGNLRFQTDSRNCAQALEYDALNRLVNKVSNGTGCNQLVDTHYYYDSDNPTTPAYDPAQVNQAGYRTYMVDASGSTASVYDTRGRLFTESKIIDDQVYTASWSYNSADLPVAMTYPDSEVLTYGYNSDGSLNSVVSSLGDTYLAGTGYDESGQITSMTYGANILRKTFTYYPASTPIQGGLLNTAVATRLSDNVIVQNLAYTYDKNANVETITDNLTGPQVQTFTYDSLNRLTSASATGGADGLYSETYEYDPASGNLSLKGDLDLSYNDPNHAHAVTNAGPHTYTYDANGNMVTRAVNGQTFDLAYDAENRLTGVIARGVEILPSPTPMLPVTETFTPAATFAPTETLSVTETPSLTPDMPTETSTPTETPDPLNTPTDTPQTTDIPTETLEPTVTYTPEGTVIPTESSAPTETAIPTDTAVPTFTSTPAPVVFANATFTYDGDGKRVKSVMQTNDGTTTTHFAGNYYEVTGSSITKYYFAGDPRIAMRIDGVLTYLLGDHLGSTSITADAAGAVTSESRYTAWGEERYATGSMPTNYTYTGQYSYAADFGLMYYGARWYDPTIGRFNQPDTNIPGNQGVQAWDRYAYVNNNPMLYVDPSGNWIETAFDLLSLAMTINDIRNEGFTVMNTISLVTDVASVILPVVPAGVSHALRAAKYANKAINAVDTAADTIKVVDKTMDAAKALDKAEDVADTGKDLINTVCKINSFSAETSVVTPEGDTAIASIQIGDYVLAWNEADGTLGYYQVTDTIHHTDKVVINLVLDGEWVVTTPEHPFYVDGKGWVEAEDLRMGDQVRQADGTTGTVWLQWAVETIQEMYNLSVDTAHTFFVGKGQWLVHNCSAPTGKRPPWRSYDDLKEKLIKKDGPICVYCGKKLPADKLTLDHFDPWKVIKEDAVSRADEIDIYHNPDNLVLSCKSCNSSKQAKNFLFWLWKRGPK